MTTTPSDIALFAAAGSLRTGIRRAEALFDHLWSLDCPPQDDDEFRRRLDQMNATGMLMARTPATTLEGLAVKLRHINEDVAADIGSDWLAELVAGAAADAARLAASAAKPSPPADSASAKPRRGRQSDQAGAILAAAIKALARHRPQIARHLGAAADPDAVVESRARRIVALSDGLTRVKVRYRRGGKIEVTGRAGAQNVTILQFPILDTTRNGKSRYRSPYRIMIDGETVNTAQYQRRIG